MPQLDREQGVQLHFDYMASKPTNSTLLLTHGYASTKKMWTPQQPLHQSMNCLSWDMRGHGQSTCDLTPELFSTEHTVEDMRCLLDHHQVDQAVIGGLSLGGYMSLAFYLAYPERTKALVLIACGPGYKNDEARDGWNTFAQRQADKLRERGAQALRPSQEVQADDHVNLLALALAAEGMLKQFNPEVINALENVSVPTLILVGKQDERYHGASQYMHKKIPHSEFAYIDDAQHAANMDNPSAVNQAIEQFVNRL